MAKDRTKIRIYGDDASGVFVAPKGTTGPTTLAAPPVGFVELGWLSEDGIDLARDGNKVEFNGFQGGAIVRTKKTSAKDTFKFICLQETATTLGLAYAGVVPTTASAVDTFLITNQTAS